VIIMELRPGEKASGVVKEVKQDGYVIELRNNVKGFATDECKSGVDSSTIKRGTEVKVVVDEKTDRGFFRLTVIEVFNKDKYLKKPDKYLKNISAQNKSGGEEKVKEELSEKLTQWFKEADRALKSIKKHRKERLDKDFWVP